MDQMRSLFASLLSEKGILLTDDQWNRFESYYRLLLEWNERMNLTGITEREQVYIKHFYDSLSLSFFVPLAEITNIADIGSGAGFPSIPLKIMFPHLRVTIVDSLNKRILFLNHLTSELALTDVECIHARAEDAGRDSNYRDRFDLVTARAVARLNVLNEFCLPFVKTGGTFAAMKGADAEEEVQEAKFSLSQLKGELLRSEKFLLPVEQSTRHIILIRKTGPTPAKYPRKPGVPLKQPLK
jgi:16S rRNA (guanine527-N7)-methyltransferase